MKVNFKNIGLVKDITFDLDKDLIICTGPNNTGKTYAIYSLYGLGKIDLWKDSLSILSGAKYKTISQEKSTIELDIEYPLVVNLLEEKLRVKLNEILEEIFINKLNVETESNVSFSINNEWLRKKVNDMNFTIDFDKSILNPISSIQKAENSFVINVTSNPKSSNTEPIAALLGFALNPVDQILKNSLLLRTFIFPAERTAIPLFSQDVFNSNALIAKSIGLNNSENKLIGSSRYFRPIWDYIVFIQNLQKVTSQKSKFAYLADYLEQEIIGSQVSINMENEIELTDLAENKKNKFKFFQSSSSIKSLAGLVLYLRYLASDKDMILIDEPELNLHPENQILLARFFALLVNKGFKVVISTHSDFIVREFNLLTKANKLKAQKDKLGILGIESDYCLDYTNLQVFHFDKNIEDVKVTDEGFDISSIDETINKQNSMFDDLEDLLIG